MGPDRLNRDWTQPAAPGIARVDRYCTCDARACGTATTSLTAPTGIPDVSGRPYSGFFSSCRPSAQGRKFVRFGIAAPVRSRAVMTERRTGRALLNAVLSRVSRGCAVSAGALSTSLSMRADRGRTGGPPACWDERYARAGLPQPAIVRPCCRPSASARTTRKIAGFPSLALGCGSPSIPGFRDCPSQRDRPAGAHCERH